RLASCESKAAIASGTIDQSEKTNAFVADLGVPNEGRDGGIQSDRSRASLNARSARARILPLRNGIAAYSSTCFLLMKCVDASRIALRSSAAGFGFNA